MMMTMKEFSEATGVDKRNIRYYCSEGLLAPDRTGSGISNNRRLFDEDDLSRMQQILIYRKLDMPIREIKKIMNAPDYDVTEALDDAIRALNRRIWHLRNVVFLARVSQAYGTTMFSFGAFTDENVDEYARMMRENPSYNDAVRKADSMTSDETEHFVEQTKALYQAFSELKDMGPDFDELEGYADKVTQLVDEYCATYNELAGNELSFNLMAYSLGFMGDGLFRREADRIGGAGTAEFMATCFMMVWMVRALKALAPAIINVYSDFTNGLDAEAHVSELSALMDDYLASEQIRQNRYVLYGKDNTGGHKEYVTDFIEMLESFSSDADMRELFGLSETEMPSKEAYRVSLEMMDKYVWNATD